MIITEQELEELLLTAALVGVGVGIEITQDKAVYTPRMLKGKVEDALDAHPNILHGKQQILYPN